MERVKYGGSTQKVVPTKASELRSQSVMANKTLHDLDENLTAMKLNKAFRNDASFSEIEREKQKIAKVF